jgi:hypothetical protein
MGAHAQTRAGRKRGSWGLLLSVVPAALWFGAVVGGLLVILGSWTAVNWAVVIIGAGATGVSWRAWYYPTRAARVVLYLTGYVVVAGALWLGAYWPDLTLGGVWSVSIAATAGLVRALDRPRTPRQ